MRIDSLNEFCDNVSIAAGASTAIAGDVIPLSSIGLDLGSADIWLVITTGDTEIITGGSAGTIYFQLASDSTASIATNGSATIHLTSNTYVTDDSAANDVQMNAGGKILIAKLPHGTYEEYLGILCTIGTTTVTAGTINAFLTTDYSAWKAYADGI